MNEAEILNKIMQALPQGSQGGIVTIMMKPLLKTTQEQINCFVV